MKILDKLLELELAIVSKFSKKTHLIIKYILNVEYKMK